jgi:hypothetical protein
MMHVSRCDTSAKAWNTLASLYSSQTRARSVNTWIALATTKKNQLSMTNYYTKMCQYADDLAASDNPLRDDELVAYLLAGIDEEFNPVFTAVVARVDPITLSELYSQLLSFEHHTSLLSHNSPGSLSSAMAASCGRGLSGGRGFSAPSRGGGHGCDRGCGNMGGRGSSDSSNSNRSSRPQCQLCGKIDHTAKKCWYRYEDDSIIEQCNAALAASCGGDDNWYTDSSATDHITGALDKLTTHDPNLGTDQIHVANGSGMNITRIGNTIIPTPHHNLVLNNVLHVPTTHRNLIFVHHFTLDNNAFIEFHPYFFDQGSKNEEGAAARPM